MFESLKRMLMRWLRLPSAPPSAPFGHSGTARVFRASPRFLLYRLLGTLAGSAVGLLALTGALVGAAVDERAPWWAPALMGALIGWMLVVMVASYFVARLDYELRYYLITDRSLLIREGAVVLRELSLSFENVQNVTIEQGPLERLLGFANVVVQTAGGGGSSNQSHLPDHHRGVLRGIDRAEEVRELIRSRLAQVHAKAGLGDSEEEHPSALGPDFLQALEAVRDEARLLAAQVRLD